MSNLILLLTLIFLVLLFCTLYTLLIYNKTEASINWKGVAKGSLLIFILGFITLYHLEYLGYSLVALILISIVSSK